MPISTYYCENKCCEIKIEEGKDREFFDRKDTSWNVFKSGVFIYDPVEEKILLVQSRGRLWGFPKGHMEIGETSQQCAIREVKEETGLHITSSDFKRAVRVRNRALYFYAELKAGNVNVQKNTSIEANDANGITWIKISCLEECIKAGQIVLNQHTQLLFRKFLKKTFPIVEFITVRRRRRRRKKILKEIREINK